MSYVLKGPLQLLYELAPRPYRGTVENTLLPILFLLDIDLFSSKSRFPNGFVFYVLLIVLCEFTFYHPTRATFSSSPLLIIRLT
jgi:hypothetical protein